jgi:hypothetical protein
MVSRDKDRAMGAGNEDGGAIGPSSEERVIS